MAKDAFLKDGWPKEKIFILGGFRFPSLKKSGRISSLQTKKKNQIVVAFSLSPVANREILRLAYEAFSHQDIDFDILFKCHPLDPLEQVAKKMGLRLSNRFKFVNQSLEEVVQESKAMIVKESSSVFWALRHDIPIIVPYLYNFVDICPLSGVSRLARYVKSPKELFSSIVELIKDKKSINEDEYQTFLNQYLEIYEEDRRYYENLVTHTN